MSHYKNHTITILKLTLTGVCSAIIEDEARAMVPEEWGVLRIGVATADLGAALMLATAAGPTQNKYVH